MSLTEHSPRPPQVSLGAPGHPTQTEETTGHSEERHTEEGSTVKKTHCRYFDSLLFVCVCMCVCMCVCPLTVAVWAVAEFRTAHFEVGITQPVEEVPVSFMSPVCACVCTYVYMRVCRASRNTNKLPCSSCLKPNTTLLSLSLLEPPLFDVLLIISNKVMALQGCHTH